jgi:hypothetical protein
MRWVKLIILDIDWSVIDILVNNQRPSNAISILNNLLVVEEQYVLMVANSNGEVTIGVVSIDVATLVKLDLLKDPLF